MDKIRGQWPQVHFPQLQLTPRRRNKIYLLVHHLGDEDIEPAEVSLKCLHHRDGFLGRARLGQSLGQHLGGDRHGGERRPQIVNDEGQMFFAAPLQLGGLLRRVIFYRHPDRLVEHAIDDAGTAPLQDQPVFLCQVLQGIPENIVFRHHFHDIEPILETLQPVRRGTPSGMCFGHPVIVLRVQGFDQFVDKVGI